MHARIVSVAALAAVFALPSLAFGKDAPKPSGMRAGINVPCLEKLVKGDNPPPEAWVALGYLDQVRGDLKEAMAKYEKAFHAGAQDLANEPIDFTLVGDAIWIQNDKCPVPVPKQGADAKPAEGLKGPDKNPDYPKALNGIAAEGNATATAVIGPDGKPMRISVKEASSGPSPVQRETRQPGEDPGERLLSRVQFALVTIQTLRDTKFADGNSGKSLTWTAHFVPPPDILAEIGRTPGAPDTSAKPSTPVTFGGAGSGGRHP